MSMEAESMATKQNELDIFLPEERLNRKGLWDGLRRTEGSERVELLWAVLTLVQTSQETHE